VSEGRVAAVVLAAGVGSRFGSTKQLASIDGRALVRVTIESVASPALDAIIVVIGHDAARVAAVLDGLPVSVVVNHDYRSGLGGSIAAGVAALPPATRAAIVALGDQPLPAGVIDALVEAWRARGAAVVVPSYRGSRGNPVLFDATMFAELAGLSGDRGARALIEATARRVEVVEVDLDPPPDVDTGGDLGALEKR